MKSARILLLLLFCTSTSVAQVIQESGDIRGHMNQIVGNMPGDSGNDFLTPSISELQTWSRALINLLNNNYLRSSNVLDSLGYDLIAYTDTTMGSRLFYELRSRGVNHWGTYLYNPGYCRSLVIQSPHPLYDFNTGKQGVHIFLETESMFFCMAGTHRCNHSSFSSCDGSTSVCSGSSESFRISDLAHVTQSAFQQSTDILFHHFNNTYFIQLHGFSKRSTDPYVILSNGTEFTPSTDLLTLFQSHLFSEDTTLTFKVAHVDTAWDRLRGFTNTQGRLINSSTNACDDNATLTSGRFFHIEQEKTKLRNDVLGWDKVVRALSNTFSCNTVGEEDPLLMDSLRLFPNPTTGILYVEGRHLSFQNVQILNLMGKDLSGSVPFVLDERQLRLDLSSLEPGLYLLQLNDQTFRILKQ